jgi:hypothetical protein
VLWLGKLASLEVRFRRALGDVVTRCRLAFYLRCLIFVLDLETILFLSIVGTELQAVEYYARLKGFNHGTRAVHDCGALAWQVTDFDWRGEEALRPATVSSNSTLQRVDGGRDRLRRP